MSVNLRRLAQSNNTPNSPNGSIPPSTPRNKIIYNISTPPSATPSISSSTPFDWDAARSRKPPPYGTPFVDKRIKALRNNQVGTPVKGTPPKRAIRKKGFIERVTSIPSEIAFQIGMFPDNLPLPSHKSSARLLGGAMHFLHFCIRISRIQRIPDTDLGWEDMYREGESDTWFDWTVIMTILLIASSILNTIYLFSRTRTYYLTLQPTTLVSSPNAKFVSTATESQPPPSVLYRLWRAFVIFWRFLLNLPVSGSKNMTKFSKTQQLEVWNPGDFEKELFWIYSPANCLLWMATNSSNWILMFILMALVQVQLSTLTHTFQTLVKDKEIIASEVMHEYDEKFVIPRVNPVRRDVAVMTHQAEVVDIWEH